jgi:hypothetical protein
MWRRFSCEQPLDTSQSILSLSGSIIKCLAKISVQFEPTTRTKGNQVLIPELGSVTVSKRLVSNVVTRLELETSTRTLGRVVFSA